MWRLYDHQRGDITSIRWKFLRYPNEMEGPSRAIAQRKAHFLQVSPQDRQCPQTTRDRGRSGRDQLECRKMTSDELESRQERSSSPVFRSPPREMEASLSV